MKKSGQKKKILSALLVIMLVFTVMPADQVFAANSTVTITESETIATIQTNIQNKLTGAKSGDVVTVSGKKTNAANAALTLNIPKGCKVIWKADLTWEKVAYSEGGISLTGAGEFEVDGGSVINKNNGSYKGEAIRIDCPNATLTLKSGTIGSADSYESTIRCRQAGVTINIKGGIVKCGSSARAIESHTSYGGVLNMSGGTIIGPYGISIKTVNITGGTIQTTSKEVETCIEAINVNMSGGKVISSGTTQSPYIKYTPVIMGISFSNSVIKISGGTITGDQGVSIDDGSIIITGGKIQGHGKAQAAGGTGGNAIIAYGKSAVAYLKGSCSGGKWVVLSGNSQIVQVDSISIPKFRHNKKTGLNFEGRMGTAVWNMSGSTPGIKFTFSDKSSKTLSWGKKVSGSQLAKPKGLKLTKTKASWKSVKNNNGYTLKIMQGKKTVLTKKIKKNAKSYKFTAKDKKKLKKGKSYTATLIAKETGIYKSSKPAKSKAARM